MNIAVLGMWHLGLTYSACLAKLGHTIVAFDEDRNLVLELSSGKLPIVEPGLRELIKSFSEQGAIRFTSDIEEIRACELVWICIDTQIDDKGEADSESIADFILKIVPACSEGTTLAISAQVPLGFAAVLQELIGLELGRPDIRLVYAPENLQLGSAIDSFLNPKRTVIGVVDGSSVDLLTTVLSGVSGEILFTTIPNAELLKHALNSYLALNISFANEVGQLAQTYGADAYAVAKLLKADERVGAKAYVMPGAPFGGLTLGRDLNYITKLGIDANLELPLIRTILHSNARHLEFVHSQIHEAKVSLVTPKIGFVGLTYKEGTSTLRGSIAVQLIERLSTESDSFSFIDEFADIRHLNEFDLVKYKYVSEFFTHCNLMVITRPHSQFFTYFSSMHNNTHGIESKIVLNYSGMALVDQCNSACKLEIRNFGAYDAYAI
jgi:UDPglucose 6-dehydrogenase